MEGCGFDSCPERIFNLYVSNGAKMHMFEESLIGTWEKNMPKMEMRRRWDKLPEKNVFYCDILRPATKIQCPPSSKMWLLPYTTTD